MRTNHRRRRDTRAEAARRGRNGAELQRPLLLLQERDRLALLLLVTDRRFPRRVDRHRPEFVEVGVERRMPTDPRNERERMDLTRGAHDRRISPVGHTSPNLVDDLGLAIDEAAVAGQFGVVLAPAPIVAVHPLAAQGSPGIHNPGHLSARVFQASEKHFDSFLHVDVEMRFLATT